MVSRLCISQWQQAWRIYFLLLWFLLFFCYFAVLYNLCCLSALFSTAALWLLPKTGKMCFFNTNELYTQQNSLTPSSDKKKKKKCAFYWRFCVKTYFFSSLFVLFFFLIFEFILVLRRKNWNSIVVTTLLCLSTNFLFSYLVAIKDTLISKCSSVVCVRSVHPFLSSSTSPASLSVSLTLELGWGWARSRTEWSWHSSILAD